MAKVEVTVCDVCGTLEGVCHVTMQCDERPLGEADLCVEHSEPLRTYFQTGTLPQPQARKAAAAAPVKRTTAATKKAVAPRRGRSRLGGRAMSMEEIEAQKKGK